MKSVLETPEFGSEFYFMDAESPPEEIPTETEYGAALNGHFTVGISPSMWPVFTTIRSG